MTINGKPSKILLVDDDSDFIQYFLSVSSSYNIGVDICKSVNEAIQRIEANAYDAYIIDLKLPDGTGYDIIKHIRQNNQKLIAVVTAAFNDEETFRLLKEKYDVQYILDKPIYHNQIKQLLSSLALSREMPQASEPGDRLKKLQHSYKQTICDKVDLISDLIAQVKNIPGKDSLTALKNAMHKIAGSAGTFGYQEVTDICKRLEREINNVLESKESIPKKWVEELDDFLQKFKYHFQFPQKETGFDSEDAADLLNKSGVRVVLFVVDPDETFLHLLEGKKEYFYQKLRTEKDPEKARSMLLSPDFNPRAVIVSQKFPGYQFSGIELIQEMQKKANYLPTIFGLLSEEDNVDLRVSSIKNGIQYFFVKPISPMVLLQAISEEMSSPYFGEFKVLILDDDENVCDFVKEALGEVGVEVQTIHHPEKLFKTLEEFAPHILILDILLPKYDGLNLLKTLRADPLSRNLAVVIITNFMDTIVSEVAYAENVLDIIYKPVKKELLQKNILELIKQKIKQGQFIPNKSRTGLDSLPSLNSRLKEMIHRKTFDNTFFILFELDRLGDYVLEKGRAFANHLLVTIGNILVESEPHSMLPFFIEPSKFAIIATHTSARKVEDDIRDLLLTARSKVKVEISLRAGIVPLSNAFKESKDILIAAEQALAQAKHVGEYSPVEVYLSERVNGRASKPEVFLIDPDEDIHQIIRSSLEYQEIQIRAFTTGEEALEALDQYQESHLPALIIIERNLPDMDGLRVLDVVSKRFDQQVPCFFLTVYSSDQDIYTGLKHGAADYITKPFNLTIFLQKVMTTVLKQTTPAQSSQHE